MSDSESGVACTAAKVPTPSQLLSFEPNLREILDPTSTNLAKDECVIFLQERGIFHNPRYCQNGHEMVLQCSDKEDKWKCRKECNTQKQLKAGTWLHGEHWAYRTVIRFVYYWSTEMATASFCEKYLGITNNSVLRWHNYLREVCASHLQASRKKIGGIRKTVEVDEIVIIKRSPNARTKPEEFWYFGGICKETKECFLVHVKERNAKTLEQTLQSWVSPGTIIISDLLEEYGQKMRKSERRAFQDLAGNKYYTFLIPQDDDQTEGTWRYAKSRYMPSIYGANRNFKKSSFFCEYMWRLNVKRQNVEPFDAIIGNIACHFAPEGVKRNIQNNNRPDWKARIENDWEALEAWD